MPGRKSGSRAIGDAAVRKGTGKGWAEWLAILDGFGAPGAGATERARHLREAHGAAPWWSHAVTSRWEWERGIRSEGPAPGAALAAKGAGEAGTRPGGTSRPEGRARGGRRAAAAPEQP